MRKKWSIWTSALQYNIRFFFALLFKICKKVCQRENALKRYHQKSIIFVKKHQKKRILSTNTFSHIFWVPAIFFPYDVLFCAAGFRLFRAVASGSSCFYLITGNFLLKFKKNPDEKYFFIMEKFDFEKIFLKFLKIFLKISKIPLGK